MRTLPALQWVNMPKIDAARRLRDVLKVTTGEGVADILPAGCARRGCAWFSDSHSAALPGGSTPLSCKGTGTLCGSIGPSPFRHGDSPALLVVDQTNRARQHVALRSMFAARKRVFVDLLRWNLPVLAGRFEVDQFDDLHATYLIVSNAADEHLASVRLLPTTLPALLDSLFPYLVDGSVPQGIGIVEITRFCLSRDIDVEEKRIARDMLLLGLVEHARASGIHSYTGVAELDWFRQTQAFGWGCRQLGAPRQREGRLLVAFQIDIGDTIPSKHAEAGYVAAGGAKP